MALRVVLRWVAAGAPFSWFGFATRFKASKDFVGPNFFQDFAATEQLPAALATLVDELA
jgi:hypothetical protein